MKQIEVTCIGCGKKWGVVCEDGHTGVVKCDCGATTTVKNDASPILDQIAAVMDKVPAILRELKDQKRQGFETGFDAGMHEATKNAVLDILKYDEKLRDKFKDIVRTSLEQSLHEGDDSEKF